MEPHFAENLRALLGVDRLDRRSLGSGFSQRPASEWERLAMENDIPLAAVAGALGKER